MTAYGVSNNSTKHNDDNGNGNRACNACICGIGGVEATSLVPAHDLVLRPVLRPIGYSISYDLDGGTVAAANPPSYNIESGDITLNNPTKEGYEFTGWTGSNGYSPSKSVTIQSGKTGDLSFTANWKAKDYQIYWAAPLSKIGEYLGTGSFTVGNTYQELEGNKRLIYTKLDGSTGYANPYKEECITVKGGTEIKLQVVAKKDDMTHVGIEGESSGLGEKIVYSKIKGELLEVSYKPGKYYDKCVFYRENDQYDKLESYYLPISSFESTNIKMSKSYTNNITSIKVWNYGGDGYEEYTDLTNKISVFKGCKITLSHPNSYLWRVNFESSYNGAEDVGLGEMFSFIYRYDGEKSLSVIGYNSADLVYFYDGLANTSMYYVGE